MTHSACRNGDGGSRYVAEIAGRGYAATHEYVTLHGALAKASTAIRLETFKVASTIPHADYELALRSRRQRCLGPTCNA